MIVWLYGIVWRLVITAGCIYTLHHLLVRNGYPVDVGSLVIMAVLFIVGVRIWAAHDY